MKTVKYVGDWKTPGTFHVSNAALFGASWVIKAPNAMTALSEAERCVKRQQIDMRGRGRGWKVVRMDTLPDHE
jgi:hypothetical protein